MPAHEVSSLEKVYTIILHVSHLILAKNTNSWVEEILVSVPEFRQ